MNYVRHFVHISCGLFADERSYTLLGTARSVYNNHSSISQAILYRLACVFMKAKSRADVTGSYSKTETTGIFHVTDAWKLLKNRSFHLIGSNIPFEIQVSRSNFFANLIP